MSFSHLFNVTDSQVHVLHCSLSTSVCLSLPGSLWKQGYDLWVLFRWSSLHCFPLLYTAVEWQLGPVFVFASPWQEKLDFLGLTLALIPKNKTVLKTTTKIFFNIQRAQIWIPFGKPYTLRELGVFWILHAAAWIYVVCGPSKIKQQKAIKRLMFCKCFYFGCLLSDKINLSAQRKKRAAVCLACLRIWALAIIATSGFNNFHKVHANSYFACPCVFALALSKHKIWIHSKTLI